MKVLESRYYGWLETATNLFLLNGLWLLACLPVVTIFSSTAAMFAVVRDWVRGKEIGLFGAFVSRFKENFKQSLTVGVAWTLFGVTLVLDFNVANGLPHVPGVVMKSLLVLAVCLYAFASVFLFPVMVHYDTKWTGVIKNALLLSIGRLPTTLACLLFVAAVAGITIVVPPLALITGAITAYVVYRLCDREFAKIDARRGNE